MGCVQASPEDREAMQRTKLLDKQLKEDGDRAMNDIKLLLLGAGECGKSTILKQMKIINMDGFGKEDFEQYREVIYSNTVQSLGSIIHAVSLLKISYGDPKRQEDAALGTSYILKNYIIIK